MKNSGLLIANEFDFARAKVLMENLERCSVSNEIVIRHDAEIICQKLKELKIIPKKILVDAPCSGEGTIRGSPETLKTWNSNMIKHFSLIQKRIASAALNLLQPGGELVYSTCTHAPEENEAVLQHLLENFNIKIEPLKLPMKTRHAVLEWLDDEFEEQIINAARIYPQDNDSEGFFLAKIIKISDKPEDINPKAGFKRYGLVKNSYILIKGSVQGPAKRLIRLNYAVRPHKRKHSETFEIEYIQK